MYLIDTSIWIDHLRKTHSDLASFLKEGSVFIHPFIIGELACGQIKNRSEILSLLKLLPLVDIATDTEVHHLIESQKLYGIGIGWVDAHLLSSALISDVELITKDQALSKAYRQVKN